MKISVYDVIIWIFFIIAVIFFFWYLFGDSPTFEQALLILILGFVIANFANLKCLRTKYDNLKRSFKTLAQDFKEHIKHK